MRYPSHVTRFLSLAAASCMVLAMGCSRDEGEARHLLLLELTPGSEPEHEEAAVQVSSCTFSLSHHLEVINPVRVSRYRVDTLGVVRLETPTRQCLGQAVEDGAEIHRFGEDVWLFYPDRFEAFLSYFSDIIGIEAVEGRWSVSQQRIIPGLDGRQVDRVRTREAFLEAVRAQQDKFEIAITTQKALSSNVSALSDFHPRHLLGTFTTQFTRSKNRTINVKLAADALDGIFLMPGAEFSYNAWVGERSEARGYREAPVIEQGQMVEGLGGGACQVSSTVHAAALLAGMTIAERYNHSLPSSYIAVGLDAVVSYPLLDLRISNPFAYPVILRVTTQDNHLTAQFFSSEPPVGRVLFRSEIVETIPYQEVITVDASLEPNTSKVTKRGKVGYKVQRARIFWKDGKEHYEKLNVDVYQPQVQNVSLGLGAVYPPLPSVLGEAAASSPQPESPLPSE
ncbi:MAG: VanW family protein [Proteobacteria bacterium]|nr:VanW family protein [Pseudomonadota bacterium]